MMDVCELSIKYGIGFTTHGEICLFNGQQSLQLIAACREDSVPILGIESYIKEDCIFILQLDGIADFSSLARGDKEVFVRDSCYSAASFIRQAPALDVMFEFVLADS